MLKSAILIQDPQIASIMELLGQGGTPKEIETGIYLTNSFSMGNDIRNKKEDYFNFQSDDEWFGAYGVSDSIEQVKERYAKWLDDPELSFCISFTEVRKDEQESQGGWRWHKWGEYIGTKDPQCEYLYDEENIESVYVYHIYQLL